jgi:hypothetical protein
MAVREPTKIISYEKPHLANLEALIQSPKVLKHEKQALKSYRDKIDEKTGYVKVEYTVEKYGRYKALARKQKEKTYTTGCSMRREHRYLLFAHAYDDLDIANSSGNVMCQIFEKHGLPTKKFRHLCDNREAVLMELMCFYPDFPLERITAKDVLIEIFFCGAGNNSLYWELNPYIKRYDLPDIIKEIKAEYLANLHHIVELPEYRDLVDHVLKKAEDKGKEAWIGTFASELYQEEERKILDSLVRGINEEGKRRKIENPTGSLIFDGLHITQLMKIREGNFIRKLEAKVMADTDYVIHLEIKSMEMTAEEKKEWLGDQPIANSYEALRADFERSRFKCKNQFFTIGVEDGMEELHHYEKASFTVLNEDAFLGATEFLKDWYVDPQKRSYAEVEYGCVKEEHQRPDVYYAFPTLRYKTLSSTSTQEERQEHIAFFQHYLSLLMEDHPIFTNRPQAVDETKEAYAKRVKGESYCKWLTLWCADILLNPDKKNSQPIACIFWGKQGSGKTMLRVLMERLLGQRCVHNTSDPTKNGDVLHDFNKTLKYKVFMELAEINLKMTSTVNDRIKDLITNHTHEIRQMRTDMIRVKATERLLFTTNNPGSMLIEKGDRRFMAVSVSKRRVGDTEYWKQFWAHLNDDNFVRDIADYLLSFKEEVDRYAFRDERPITAYYKRLQCMSLSPELDFLKDLFFYHEDDMGVYQQKDGTYFIGSTPLLELYNGWRERHSMREKVSIKTFVLKLKSLDTEYGITHKEKEHANGVSIDPIALKETLANDFDIRPDDDQTCMIDFEK